MGRRSSKLPHTFSPLLPRTDLELRHLRVFVALVEHGSLTAASRALGLAQSTVSETLAALERALGAVVVRRQAGVQAGLLTTAGHALLPHARQLLATVERTYTAVAQVASSTRGIVEIAASESISTYILPEVLADVRARRPNVRVSVSVATSDAVREGIDDGSVDLGLLMEFALPPQGGGTLARFADRRIVVSREPLVVFTAPGHPLAAAAAHQASGAQMLATFPLLVSHETGELRSLIERMFQNGDLAGPVPQLSGSVEAVKRGVIADPRAIGMLPSYAVAEDLQQGRVARVSLRRPPPPMRLVAVLSRSRARHPVTNDVVEGIRSCFLRRRPSQDTLPARDASIPARVRPA